MFGTFAEQRHFVYPTKDTYYGVLLNGNMVAHAPDGLAAFLLEKTKDQRYVIDPLTHAFQHEVEFVRASDGSLKTSIAGLAEFLGEPVSSVAGKRPLRPKDIPEGAALESFVGRTLHFQKTELRDRMAENDSAKYFPSTDHLRPYAVVAPYFYMNDATYERWLDSNIRCAQAAVRQEKDCRVFAAVVVGQGVIADASILDKIVEAYKGIGVAGFLLWVDELSEHEAPQAILSGMLRLARGLRGSGTGTREVINTHGGYFSVLATVGTLGSQALTAVAHGPEFGEARAVVPVGGGIPISRYYIPDLHARVRYKDAVSIFRAKGWLKEATTFHQHVCDCSECLRTIAGDPDNFALFGASNTKLVTRGYGLARMEYPTAEAKVRCLQHYLQRKAQEYAFVRTASADQLRANLEEGEEEFADVLGDEGVSHLANWAKALGSS